MWTQNKNYFALERLLQYPVRFLVQRFPHPISYISFIVLPYNIFCNTGCQTLFLVILLLQTYSFNDSGIWKVGGVLLWNHSDILYIFYLAESISIKLTSHQSWAAFWPASWFWMIKTNRLLWSLFIIEYSKSERIHKNHQIIFSLCFSPWYDFGSHIYFPSPLSRSSEISRTKQYLILRIMVLSELWCGKKNPWRNDRWHRIICRLILQRINLSQLISEFVNELVSKFISGLREKEWCFISCLVM